MRNFCLLQPNAEQLQEGHFWANEKTNPAWEEFPKCTVLRTRQERMQEENLIDLYHQIPIMHQDVLCTTIINLHYITNSVVNGKIH